MSHASGNTSRNTWVTALPPPRFTVGAVISAGVSMDPQAAAYLCSPRAPDLPPFLRATVEVLPRNERFLVRSRAPLRQYYALCNARLRELRTAAVEAAGRKWGEYPDLHISESVLGDVEEQDGAVASRPNTVVVGTTFVSHHLKPSVLHDFAAKLDVEPLPPRLGDERDRVYLEDENGRIALQGIPRDAVVGGMVIAALGQMAKSKSSENEKAYATGEFDAADWTVPDMAPQPPRPLFPQPSPRVLLVSGLEVGRRDANPLFARLLEEWIEGHAGGPSDIEAQSRISRVIVAGNSLAPADEKALSATTAAALGSRSFMASQSQLQGSRHSAHRHLLEPLQALDAFLSRLGAAVHVDVLPGWLDPANFSLPQQPLHLVLFPLSAPLSTVHFVTNPHDADVAGVRFVGTAGQNIDDMFIYTASPGRMQLMELCVRSRCICPTSPESLPCFPFDGKEPFVLAETPHVFFAGNQPEFGTKLVEGTSGQTCRLISVPRFADTHSAVVLDLATLEATTVCFAVEGMEA